ncbi:MAG: helix-turn-helix transcriptional regulator [Candidatus Uhrbacteria bacterium]
MKDFRAKLDLTQEELAQKLGVTRQTIIALEQAKYQPSLELAWRCSRLFRVPIEDVFSFIN